MYAKPPNQSQLDSQLDSQPRPVSIDYFALHAFESGQHLFAVVSWLKEHPNKDHYSLACHAAFMEITNQHIFLTGHNRYTVWSSYDTSQ